MYHTPEISCTTSSHHRLGLKKEAQADSQTRGCKRATKWQFRLVPVPSHCARSGREPHFFVRHSARSDDVHDVTPATAFAHDLVNMDKTLADILEYKLERGAVPLPTSPSNVAVTHTSLRFLHGTIVSSVCMVASSLPAGPSHQSLGVNSAKCRPAADVMRSDVCSQHGVTFGGSTMPSTWIREAPECGRCHLPGSEKQRNTGPTNAFASKTLSIISPAVYMANSLFVCPTNGARRTGTW